MIRPTPAIKLGGPIKIVHKLNLNSVMVQLENYHANENVYNKPYAKNGL